MLSRRQRWVRQYTRHFATTTVELAGNSADSWRGRREWRRGASERGIPPPHLAASSRLKTRATYSGTDVPTAIWETSTHTHPTFNTPRKEAEGITVDGPFQVEVSAIPPSVPLEGLLSPLPWWYRVSSGTFLGG